MGVYLVFVLVIGVLCWATFVRALPSHVTFELVLLCCFVGIFVWLGVLPFVGFWVLFRSGSIGSLIPSDQALIIELDVTFVRLCLSGPLALLAGALFAVVAFVWERMCPRGDANSTVKLQA
jgi:hypothetical protein